MNNLSIFNNLNNLNCAQQQALADFKACKSWEARTKLLITYGMQLDDFPASAKTNANLILGCSVPSWLIGNCEHGCNFKAYSEAKITKGLLALLLLRINNEPVQILDNLDITKWFACLGLGNNISHSRADGLQAAFTMIKKLTKSSLKLTV